MSKSDVQKLKKACSADDAHTEVDRLKEGETTWLAGRPVASAKGTVRLSLSSTVSLILQETDVLDAVKDKDGDAYIVKVRSDSDVMFRQDVVLKADPLRGGDCDCSSEDNDQDDKTAALRPLPPEIVQVPEIPDFFFDWDNPGQCFSQCFLTFKCTRVSLGDGKSYKVCYPSYKCETLCAPGTGK